MLNRSLGFIGLGAIGLPIAANLAIAGYKLKIHTRSRSSEKDQRLKDAIPCPNPKDVAKDCDVLFVCVSDDEAIEDTLFNSEGAYQTLQPKSIVIDFSTVILDCYLLNKPVISLPVKDNGYGLPTALTNNSCISTEISNLEKVIKNLNNNNFCKELIKNSNISLDNYLSYRNNSSAKLIEFLKNYSKKI